MCPAERRKRARLAGKLTVCTRVLAPNKRSLTITHPWFKNPFSIANKISGYNLWRQNLACYKFRRINQTNDELAMSWSRCPDWNAWAWQNDEFPAERRVALTSFCWAHDVMFFRKFKGADWTLYFWGCCQKWPFVPKCLSVVWNSMCLVGKPINMTNICNWKYMYY